MARTKCTLLLLLLLLLKILTSIWIININTDQILVLIKNIDVVICVIVEERK